MRIRLGPVLYIDPPSEERWSFRVQFLVEGDGPLDLELTSPSDDVTVGAPVRVAEFAELGPFACFSWRITARRGAEERRIAYRFSIGGATTEIEGVAIPARGALPRIAFFSCNGFSSVDLMHDVEEPNALWSQMAERHAAEGLHLLVGGGDQVYADSLLVSVPLLRAFWEKRPRKRKKYVPSPTFERQVLGGYVQLYRERWSQKEVAHLLARVPGVFTWDDHDIFDGWGSYDDDLNGCPGYQSIFAQARRAFLAFQLGGASPPHVVGAGPHLLQGLGFRESGHHLDLLLLDLRSDRSRKRVLSPRQWSDLDAWLESHAAAGDGAKRHLFVVSTIPVVHMTFGASESFLGFLPGRQELEDDLRDQWESGAHRGERDRLAMTLLRHARDAGCATTILSGDVHIGARGRLRSRRADHVRNGETEAWIDQITSSAIVHPAPTGFQMAMLRLLGGEGKSVIANGVEAELLRVSSSSRYVERRNWLSAGFDRTKCRAWLQWQTEEGPVEPQVVVEPS